MSKKLTFSVCFLFLSVCFVSNAQSKSEKIKQLVQYYADENRFNGTVLVAEKENILYKGAIGMANMEWNAPNTPDTRFRIGSISKQFTSMLIMQLVQEGKIDLHKPITTYLPHYRMETGDKITTHHLLTHSSGIPNYTDNREFYNHSTKYISVPDFVRLFCSGDLEFEPGTKFTYSNSGYFILGAMIEALTKQTYEKALHERILNPLDLQHTGYDNSEPLIHKRAAGYVRRYNGYRNANYLHMSTPYAAGSLYSTVEDLFKWNLALNKKKLLAETQLNALYKPFLPVYEIPFFGGDKDSVASGWFVKQFRKADTTQTVNMIWHSGGINGFLTELARFPEEGYFISILDNTEGASEALLKDLIAILYDLPTPPKKKSFANALQQKIINGSIKDAYNFSISLDSVSKAQYDFTSAENLINRWGYQLLNDEKNINDALLMFSVNVKLFPKSFNVYDSYGEALHASGNYEEALKNYKQAVALNPSYKPRVQHILDGLALRPDTVKVTVDGHQMVLYKYGNKGPVVVLEAGGMSDHTSWNSIVGTLSKEATVITYDRPGYRQSVSCNKPRTANRIASELYEALKKAGIKGPYVLGGWSWGGFFVRTFAGLYPAVTKGLLLVDPADERTYMQMAKTQADAFMKIDKERPFVHFAAEDEFDAMLPVMFQAAASDSKYKGKIELLIAGSMKEWSEDEKPLKLIWNEELQSWGKRNSNIHTVVVDAGHFIQREKPEVVIEAVRRLLK